MHVASFVLSACIAFAAVAGTKKLVREYRQQWHNAAQANELGDEKDEGYDVESARPRWRAAPRTRCSAPGL